MINEVVRRKVEDFLICHQIEYFCDVSLREKTYFKTGGKVSFYVVPGSIDEFSKLIQFLRKDSLSFKVFGATSNCFFYDEQLYGIFISTKRLNRISFQETDAVAIVEAGVLMPVFAKESVKKGYGGFEGLCGIPGTIGGGIIMNAGAFGSEIADCLLKVLVIDEEGNKLFLHKDQLSFSFRHSAFRNKKIGVIAQAFFRLEKGNPDQIKENILKYTKIRNSFQECKYPNLGSIFSTYDIYRDIADCCPLYKIIFFINRIYSKLFKPCDNRFINFLTKLFFRWNFKSKPYSDKTLNCIVNRGNNYKDVLNYVGFLKKLLGHKIILENEFIKDE